MHFVLLHHGHGSSPNSISDLETHIRETWPQVLNEEVLVYSTPVNSGMACFSGIVVMAVRVFQDLSAKLEALKKDGRPVSKISFVGVSLGGVVLSHLCNRVFYHKSLEESGSESSYLPFELIDTWPMYKDVSFENLITFGSPLVGLKKNSWAETFARLIAPIDTSMRDVIRGISMSLKNTAIFKRRLCIGCLNGDWRVPLESALVEPDICPGWTHLIVQPKPYRFWWPNPHNDMIRDDVTLRKVQDFIVS